MSKRGRGHGSEDHLRRYLQVRPDSLTARLLHLRSGRRIGAETVSELTRAMIVNAHRRLVRHVGAPLDLLITTAGFSEAARRRALHFRGLSLNVVELDDLAAWRQRWPTIAVTAGTNIAILTWFDES